MWDPGSMLAKHFQKKKNMLTCLLVITDIIDAEPTD